MTEEKLYNNFIESLVPYCKLDYAHLHPCLCIYLIRAITAMSQSISHF